MRSLQATGTRLLMFCSAAAIAVALPVSADAAIINVPADQATIAAAVTAAAPNDTVIVAAGNYPEQITVNKPLTLLGPNAGISPNTGSRVAEAVISTAVNHGFILSSTGTSLSDVKISGFQFDSITSQGIRAANDDFFDIEISYNLFTRVGAYAVLSTGGTPVTKNGATQGGTRQNWVIHDNRIDGYTATTSYGFDLINAWSENLVFTDNVVRDTTGLGIGRGAWLEGLSSATLSGNTFIGQNRYGIILNDGAENVTVVGNTFSGCVRGLVLSSSRDATSNPFTIDSVLVSANQFVDQSNISVDVIKGSAGSGFIGNIYIDGNTFTQDAAALTASVGLIELKLDSAYLAGPFYIAENTVTVSGTFAAGAVHVYGTRIRGGGVGTVDIARNSFDGGGITGALSSGVHVKTSPDTYGLIQPGATIRVSENFITGFTNAVITRNSQFGDLPLGVDLLVHGNNLESNGGGVANDESVLEMVDASANWWGSSDLLTVAGLAGAGVDWTPILLTMVDTDLVTPGFQGDFTNLQVDISSPQQGATSRIQEAVDLANGSMVLLTPGIFTEQVEIAKDVELVGAGVGATVITSPPTLTSFFTAGPDTSYPVLLVQDAAGVHIRDLTVDGAGEGNANAQFVGIGYRNAGGTITDCDIIDVRNEPIDASQNGMAIYALADDGNARALDITGCSISGFQKNGITLLGADLTATVDANAITGAGPVTALAQNGIQLGSGASGSIINNTITGFSYEPATVASAGVLILDAGSSVPVTGNIVSECQIGIWYISSEGDILENQVANTPGGMGTTPYWWCIVADPGEGTLRQPPPQPLDVRTTGAPGARARSASAAALTTQAYRNTVDGGGGGTGIEADALGTEVLNFTATENHVTNCAAGFALYNDVGATLNADVRYNGIEGNSVGLDNQSTSDQMAYPNWWGDVSGPGAVTNPGATGNPVTSAVYYSPWLAYPDDDPGTPGYQAPPGMNWQINATTPLALSKTVGLAAAGDTLSIRAGTYTDNLTIDKTLALLGADAAQITLYPSFSDTGSAEPPSLRGSQLLVVRANDVVVDGLTLDGDSPTLTPPGVVDARNGIVTDFENMGSWNNLTVTNCVIRNIYWRALFVRGNLGTSGHVVRGNTLDNVRGGSASAAIMLAGSTGEIVGNTVSDASTGVAFLPGTTGSIAGGRADSNQVSACDVGMLAEGHKAAVSFRHNAVSDGGTGVGIQLLAPRSATDVEFNAITGCDTGIAVHGGWVLDTIRISNNDISDGPSFPSFGIFTSTVIDDSTHSDVYTHVRGNRIANNTYGVFLNEDAAHTERLSCVTIGGAPADSNQLGQNTAMEIFLSNCDDPIDARYNSWSVDCDNLEDYIYHQVDDTSLGLVDFSNPFCALCPIDITGDVDTTGFVTSGDVIYMVNFVFKGGPAPLPIPEAGDVNCNGTVNSTDVIYLVNFVFKGGPAPCDACSTL